MTDTCMDLRLGQLTLEKMAEVCGGKYVGPEEMKNEVITGAERDSRAIKEGYLFVAIPGERVDGHKFINQTFEKGALCALAQKEVENPAGPYILVENTIEALQKIAEYYRETLTIPVVGIIGSVGKTSTKEMVTSVLAQKYDVLKTIGNLNNEIGVPLTVLSIHKNHQAAVLEMGISDFNEMHVLGQIAKPDAAVITNIGQCHLEFLHTRDGILQAKTEVFDHMNENSIAILNGDDDKLVTKTLVNGKAPVFYGVGETSDLEGIHTVKAVWADNIENLGFEGMKADFHTPAGDFTAQIHIPGAHNVNNALAAAAVGLQYGLTLDEVKAGIEAAQTIAGRTNFLHVNDMIVIDDCYNANPVSMKASIDTLSYGLGRTIAVLGDMGELGKDEAKLHAEVGTAVGEKKIDVLFCAGDLAVNYAEAAKAANPECDVHWFASREEMIPELLKYVQKGDSILVKASHFMGFPEVVEALSR